jgi:hypothetical protein
VRLTRHAAVPHVRALPVVLGLSLALAATAPVVATPGTACAGTERRAVLVVDSGSRDLRYCVALDGEAVTGIELIRLAGAQHGLDFRLGFGGEAVCRLAGVGTDGGDCFGDYPDFWGYWRGEATGGWSWSSAGAGDTVVHPGDVEGWSWGSGQDGATHPQPARTAFTSVCGSVPAPDPAGDPGDQHGDGGGNPGTGGEPGAGPEPGEDRNTDSTRGDAGDASSGAGDSASGANLGFPDPEREPSLNGSGGGDRPNRPNSDEDTDGEGAGAAPGASATPVGAIAAPPPGGGGPPASGLMALAIVLVLVVAGAIVARRTRAAE